MTHFTDISLRDIGPIAIDFETRDPKLDELGSDCYGCTRGGYPFVFAMYHPQFQICIHNTSLEWDAFFNWLTDQITQGGCHFVGHNIKYDMGWLHWLDCWTHDTLKKNTWSCTQVRAALLNSNDRHLLNLDGQASVYGLQGKEMDELLQELHRLGIPLRKGSSPKTIKKAIYDNLNKMNIQVVKDYCLQDTRLAYYIYHNQEPLLMQEGLFEVWELEQKVTPTLAAMESKGIRIDVKALHQLEKDVKAKITSLQAEVDKEAGEAVSPNPSHSLYRALVKQSIKLAKTATGQPKTDKKALEQHAHIPFIDKILELRKLTKLLGTFIQNSLMANLCGDRIYVTFHQLATDDSGTITGRLSCSNPNGQQIPKRDEIWGPVMRGLFIPEEGYEYLSADYSKQEPRLAAHYALVLRSPGATNIVKAFRDNPNLDPHTLVAEWAELIDMLGAKLGYNAGKTMNLGLSYGMQHNTLAANLIALGVPEDKVDSVENAYHRAFPHIRGCSNAAARVAHKNGYVRTLSGRKYRFDQWGPKGARGHRSMPLAEAEKYYFQDRGQHIERVGTHKAFNSIIQGSAADQTKKAMVELYYSHGIVPNLQVHDEINDSEGTPEKAEIYQRVMEEAYPLHVPVRVSVTLGKTWAGQ